MADQKRTISIIGGGAAGLSAAIAAADNAQKMGYSIQVILYEKDDRIGRSILATGNGRCNFSNSHIHQQEYFHSEFVSSVYGSRALDQLASDSLDAVHSMFSNLGLVWREEADGRQFPLANKASVVLDVLRARATQLNVAIECECEVVAIEEPSNRSNRFVLRMSNGELRHSESVIVACGGHNAAPIKIDFVPLAKAKAVLGPLSVLAEDRAFTKELDNIRVRAAVSLWRKKDNLQTASDDFDMVAQEAGELMFRKYGLSGICIFNLSRFAKHADKIRINFLHALNQSAEEFLYARYQALQLQGFEPLTYETMLRGLVLPRVAEALLKRYAIEMNKVFDLAQIADLVQILTCCEVEVEGIANPELCQVQRGGFSVEAFDPETLQIRQMPGFFAAGEAIDVDGPCGGYNLHWAWASGLVAGSSAVSYLGHLYSKEPS